MRPLKTQENCYASSRVEVRFYEDGSGPSLDIFEDGRPRYGVNERLYIAQQSSDEDLLLNPKATRLRYVRDFSYDSMPFFVINGDTGRLFPPQAWAKGFLPILPLDRVFAFCEYGENEEFLKFNQKEASQSLEFLKVVIILLLRGWRFDGSTFPNSALDLIRPDFMRSRAYQETQLIRLIQEGIFSGTPPSKRAIEQAISELIRDEMVKAYLVGGFTVSAGYSESIESTIGFLKYLWGLVEPFAEASDVDPLSFSELKWWSRVSKQGWKSPHSKHIRKGLHPYT